jgi:hypothetical protein
MLKIRPFILISITLTFSLYGRTQSSSDTSRPKPIIITGAIDGYYRYDFARTAANDYTAFTNTHNTFNLGTANIKVEHKTSHVDMVADLAYGPREKAYAYNDKGVARAIKQLYLSYSPTNWLKFTAGTWATHLCYEAPDAAANRNYSMSYLFSSDPFSHTGIKAEFTTGRSGFMIGVVNPCDYRTIPSDAHNNKDIIAQYSYSLNNDTKFSLNYVGGRDVENNRNHQVDLVATAKPTAKLTLGFNGTIARSSFEIEKNIITYHWWGSALYCSLDPKPWLGFTLRTEYFNDAQGLKLPTPANVFESTLSTNIRFDGFTLIPEFRIDNSNNPIFFHADGSPAHSAGSFLIAAVYAF